ncbi:RidA family protein [Mycolicibacterium sp. CBMA 226]|uniref:RidA family protein n=1 Tax=Mycolicibacterium sp. CBMA 226 TaxID=2606611 RepID=UPI0012DFE4E8|nr:RidA family protein [Mycolicibacterium sp. CBMA 226]MUL79039.1 RidA family protein [Mycolicibacterium sp. CBMA 226]QGW61361.1 2-aminomuconate deaminase [Mycolicibacterium sp.]
MSLAFSASPDVHEPLGTYSHIVACPAGASLVYISGQVPVRPDGTWPASFADQADQVFANIAAHLASAGIDPADVVKVNSYIVDHDGDPSALLRARSKHLGDHRPAATGILIAGLINPEWKLEVEVVAMRPSSAP